MDIALGLNSSGTNQSTFPDYRNPPLDGYNQMPRDGSVYTITNTSAAIHSQTQNNRPNESHLENLYNARLQYPHPLNATQYSGNVHRPDAIIQNDLSQTGNQMAQLDTPPPTYQDFISGVTFL